MRPDDCPLTEFELFRTDDAEVARLEFERLLSPHALQTRHRGGRLDARCHAVSFGDTSLIYAQYGAAVRLDPGSLDSFYLVGMPIAGASRVRAAGSEVVSRPGLASVQSCTRPVVVDWDDGCRKLSVKIGRAALERRLAGMLGRAPTRPVEFDPRFDLTRGGGASWSRLVDFLLTELSP